MKRLLFDFTNESHLAGWKNLDDIVMGGISSSKVLRLENKYLSFQGEVSLENNGGFASIRSPCKDFQMEDTKGICICVRGDGKKYKLTLRTDKTFDGLSYQVPFATSKGIWEEISFQYDQFVPSYHGRILPGEQSLNPNQIKRFGFIISERQAGSFQLDIASIWAFF